ncbi:MAG: PDZ domain-containing protein, partial [Desulfosarcina sp.]|nr:PDZ domain-containing protein [Desulfobacterales bacterium]
SVEGEDQILEIEKPASTGRPRPAARAAKAGIPPKAPRPPASRAPVRRSVRLQLSRLGPISDNPEDWRKYATVAPYKGKDGASGLMFNRIKPSSPLRRLGIRNGDVLLNINDQPVSALGDIFESLSEVSAGEEFNLRIKRRGRERQLDFIFE